VFGGPEGKTYYFLIEKLDKVYQWVDIPHYNKEDAIQYAQKWKGWKVRPDIDVNEIFQHSTSFGLAVLEEGKFNLWTWGRIVCVGDAIHKMALNIGTGGNAAIESVAVLANELTSLLQTCNGDLPTEYQIESCFQAYQKRREPRANLIVDIAGEITRMEAMDGPHHRLIVNYFLPYLGDFLANSIGDYLVTAELLVRLNSMNGLSEQKLIYPAELFACS
jgi:2-polyprenyl-6-methoxyphenol hydroxylase-like FAD-dependent oxidoreductase